MSLNQMKQRQHAHFLIDVLPEEKLAAVHSLLEVLVQPLDVSLAKAQVEHSQIGPETETALDCARSSVAHSEGISHEDVLHEFGL